MSMRKFDIKNIPAAEKRAAQVLSVIYERLEKQASSKLSYVEYSLSVMDRLAMGFASEGLSDSGTALSNPKNLNAELGRIIAFAEEFIGESATRIPRISFDDLTKMKSRPEKADALGMFRGIERDVLITNRTTHSQQARALPHEYAHFYIDNANISSEFDPTTAMNVDISKMPHGPGLQRERNTNPSEYAQNMADLTRLYVYMGMGEAAAMLFEAAYSMGDDDLIVPYLITHGPGNSIPQLSVVINELLRKELRAAVGVMFLNPIISNLDSIAKRTGTDEEFKQKAESQEATKKIEHETIRGMDYAPYIIGTAAIAMLMITEGSAKAAFQKIIELIRVGPEQAEIMLYDYAYRSFGDAKKEARFRSRIARKDSGS